MDTLTIGIILTFSLGAVGYFTKKKFDKIDCLCKSVGRIETALMQIPCVANFLKKNNGDK